MAYLSLNYLLRREGERYLLYCKITEKLYTISAKLYHFLRILKSAHYDLESLYAYLKGKGVDTTDIESVLTSEGIDRAIAEDDYALPRPIETRDPYTLPSPSSFTLATPRRIDWQLTERCNLACRHCFVSSSPIRDDSRVPLSRLETLFQEMDDLDVQTLKISGGEAFTHPDVDAILALLPNRRFETIVLTNAMLLPDARLNLLANAKARLGISLDGLDEASHDFIRGKGAFRLLMRNIKRIESLAIPFGVTITTHPKSVDQLESIVHWALNELGAQNAFINMLKPLGRAKGDGQLTITANQEASARSVAERLAQQYGDNRVLLGDDVEVAYDDPPSPGPISSKTALVCAAGNSILSLDTQLRVYPCVYAHTTRSCCIGDLKTSSLLDLWHSSAWRPYRGGTTLGEVEGCNSCANSSNCDLKNCRLKPLHEGRLFLSHVSYCKQNPPS